jgi:hypothetical protein
MAHMSAYAHVVEAMCSHYECNKNLKLGGGLILGDHEFVRLNEGHAEQEGRSDSAQHFSPERLVDERHCITKHRW